MENVKDLAFEDYKHGMKLKDISEKHGIKESTVRSWKNRHWKDESTIKTLQCNEEKAKVQRNAKNAAKLQDISWAEIENEYVTDISRKPCTLEGLSDKYDVSVQTMFDYSAKNHWKEKRKKYKEMTKKKTAEKTVDNLSDELSKVATRHLKLSDKLIYEIEKALEDEDELYKYVEVFKTRYGQGKFEEKMKVETLKAINEKKLLTTVNALEKLQKMQNTSLSILSPKESQETNEVEAWVKSVLETSAEDE